MQYKDKTIGIVGGVGSFVGIDLADKILKLSQAKCESQHPPIAMLSRPNLLADRTQFLLGQSPINPAIAISEIIHALSKQGASVIGIPCNTAHAPCIFDAIIDRLPPKVKLLNMIDEVCKYIVERYPMAKNIGVLSTTGTYLAGIYDVALTNVGLDTVKVSSEIQERYIHAAIYDKRIGVKLNTDPIHPKAITYFKIGIEQLAEEKVDAIILGCTEIPLAITEKSYQGIPLVDSTRILAQALIANFITDKV